MLVGERYWRRAVDFDFLVRERTIDARDRRLFRYAESTADIWRAIEPGRFSSGVRGCAL